MIKQIWTVTFGQSARTFYTEYHAEQFSYALALNGTQHTITRKA
jgi:hypothetical protein